MTEPATERARKVIESAHADLSHFARDSYRMHGRGAISMRVPVRRPGSTTHVPTNVVYHTLEDFRAAAAQIVDQDDANVLLQMIETYDPARQAVVTVRVGNDHPMSVTMRLTTARQEKR